MQKFVLHEKKQQRRRCKERRGCVWFCRCWTLSSRSSMANGLSRIIHFFFVRSFVRSIKIMFTRRTRAIALLQNNTELCSIRGPKMVIFASRRQSRLLAMCSRLPLNEVHKHCRYALLAVRCIIIFIYTATHSECVQQIIIFRKRFFSSFPPLCRWWCRLATSRWCFF